MSEPTAETFAERVRRLREAKKYTQNELADKAELAPAALSRILSGDRAPRMEHILALAEALAVTVSELTQGTEAAAAVEAWVSRERYEESESRRFEAESRGAADKASLVAAAAELAAMRTECQKLRADIARCQQSTSEHVARAAGDRARIAALEDQIRAAAEEKARVDWAHREALNRVASLQTDMQRNNQAQIGTAVVAASLGALLGAVAAAEAGPAARRRR